MSLFVKMFVRLLQLFSNCKEDFAHLITNINLYYQIRDDYFNLYHKEFTTDTNFADDISSGTFTFPVIHAIRNHPEDQQIIHILRRRTKDFYMKRYCIELLEQFGSFDYTRATLEEMDKQIREEIQRLGGNPLLVKCMDDLLDWKQ
ncbi:terpene synthase-like [Hylaeus volcanicus]|uniref:terpene synthase-like n=1 Tax=Hylaeus volcanicus TaxID=313075 RepID=UPI0023B8791A|nr:terpene synthase-like [Hylaeus volcanicus]